MSHPIKLLKVKKAPASSQKKWTAVFMMSSGRTRCVHFGGRGNADYTLIHKRSSPHYMPNSQDRQRKRRAYLARHSKNGENWRNPASPGALSRWILWEKPSMTSAIANYKRKFKL